MGAEITNGLRAFRIQLNGLIRDCLLIGMTYRPPLFTDPSDYELLATSTQNLQTISDEIIASVPQYLGYVPATLFSSTSSYNVPPTTTSTPSTASTTNPSPSPTPTLSSGSATTAPSFLWSPFPPPHPSLPLGTLPLVRSASGCHMPWALMTVATTDVATPDIRAWVARRLEQVGTQCHVQQAAALAKRVREASWVEGWWRGVCPKDGRGWREDGEGTERGKGREASVEGSQLGD